MEKQAEYLNPQDNIRDAGTVRSIEIFDGLLLRVVTDLAVLYLAFGQTVELLPQVREDRGRVREATQQREFAL